jgi:hypothetical protein
MLWTLARIALALWGLACIGLALGELLLGQALASEVVPQPSTANRLIPIGVLALYGLLLLCSPRRLAQVPWVYFAALCFASLLAVPPLLGFNDALDALTYVLFVLLPTGLACTMVARERYGPGTSDAAAVAAVVAAEHARGPEPSA